MYVLQGPVRGFISALECRLLNFDHDGHDACRRTVKLVNKLFALV